MSRDLIPTTLRWLASMAIMLIAVSTMIARQEPASASLKQEEVREAEQRLSDLGYWTGPVDGKLDGSTRHALIAFQKVEGRQRTGKLTPVELQALMSATRPKPVESGFAHVEIDAARQVLFIVDANGTVSKILPVSTGTGKLFTASGWTRRACTPCGRFTIYRKIDGWRRSPLGLLYYPNYIRGGIAIHGNPSVPVQPASHGCIRIPMFAAKEFSEITPIGTVVIIHDGSSPVDDPPPLDDLSDLHFYEPASASDRV